MNLKNKKIWVAGHNGLVGSSICKNLQSEDCNLIKVNRSELDLMDFKKVKEWMYDIKPEIIVLAAAKVGGINANKTYPADFITENIVIQTNLIRIANEIKIEKLIFLGSACAYPVSNKALKESDLLSSKPEPTNQPYAIAKIAGIEMCEAYNKQHNSNFLSVLPSNLYGANDNFSEETGHVIPALISKIHKAKNQSLKSIEIWGTGNPQREFLHIDDFAEALIFLLKNKINHTVLNIGSGHEISIKDLSIMIAKIIDYEGRIIFNPKFPDGVMRKFLDSSKFLDMGWRPKINLDSGIRKLYEWYKKNKDNVKK